MEKYERILDKFKGQHIAVIGDLMLDKYIFGKVERISPEAPIPIVTVSKEKFTLGGSANVAANISTLGGKAFLLGVLGEDEAGEKLIENAKDREIDCEGIIFDPGKTTIQKIRVIGQNQQLLRIDYEDGNYIESDIAKYFLTSLNHIQDLKAIIISDYAKGTITKELITAITNFAQSKGIPVVVDPKPIHASFYKNISLLTPNLKEAQEISHLNIDSLKDLENCGDFLKNSYKCDIIITTGAQGISIFPTSSLAKHIPTHATEVFDVSGAGDTVISTLTLALCAGADLSQAADLANHAAGIKVSKLGTAPVHWEELKNSFNP